MGWSGLEVLNQWNLVRSVYIYIMYHMHPKKNDINLWHIYNTSYWNWFLWFFESFLRLSFFLLYLFIYFFMNLGSVQVLGLVPIYLLASNGGLEPACFLVWIDLDLSTRLLVGPGPRLGLPVVIGLGVGLSWVSLLCGSLTALHQAPQCSVITLISAI